MTIIRTKDPEITFFWGMFLTILSNIRAPCSLRTKNVVEAWRRCTFFLSIQLLLMKHAR
ncbi:hypothetical protein NXT3_PB00190 (plasmid) [Sinorhizobium fredii]|uniref:Uncharacterized protein n=1 Tax=Rhizobium fredii TaxID=380 RepID=A0A2L0HBG1_RHIFR|nr:hypothetical protein NXT3_PB00190 [Sinorhizobium fredii]